MDEDAINKTFNIDVEQADSPDVKALINAIWTFTLVLHDDLERINDRISELAR